ncbi:DUF2726 domain-containing protein [Chryseobacterium sp. 18068]|uniref:DUF2726 domain-containing protein n=1 Tax=Chryseobacterium sp. 18068 TaxID=2681414 RepID=UPI001357DABC|nr:DUF2726 domain-containing protein [Chryseobacterium sp. 18068]
MKYSDLETKSKHFINGKISQYMDAYIRQNKVWTPEQMHSDFFEFINGEINKSSYTKHSQNGIIWSSELSMNWLLTSEGNSTVMDRFQKKYLKDKPVANRKSPLVERVRFGIYWKNLYDINFGLKDGYNFIETKELKNLKVLPWTIEHVNKELLDKYTCTLKESIEKVSTSFLEKTFSEYWFKHYYSDNSNSALIPEVCGMRSKFYYYNYNNHNYTTRAEIPVKGLIDKIKPINFRFDFLVINFNKQKMAFIELDGFEFHKTRDQQTLDSIKRNKASSLGIPLLTFTSKRISDDIKSVFSELDSFLK